MRRVIVCGGRDYTDRAHIAETLHRLCRVAERDDTIIVHGAARGADSLAGEIAEGWGLTVEPHPADWERYGKGAGHRRNAEMVKLGAVGCVAFPGGTGTEDCVRRCEAAGIRVVRA